MHPIFEKLQRDIAQSLEGLDAGQTQLRPINSPDKWTIQQIVQHLCLSYSSTDDAVLNRLDKDRPTRTLPTVPQRCAQFFVTKLNFFPTGREAPSGVVPPAPALSSEFQMSGPMLAHETARYLAQTDQLLGKADSRFGSARFASHGVLGPLSASQWRSFHLVHGRHHVKQIWAIRHGNKI